MEHRIILFTHFLCLELLQEMNIKTPWELESSFPFRRFSVSFLVSGNYTGFFSNFCLEPLASSILFMQKKTKNATIHLVVMFPGRQSSNGGDDILSVKLCSQFYYYK